MSESVADRATTDESVALGDVDPAGSRHAGRRSAVTLADETVVVGTADGTVRAFDRDSLAERWTVEASARDASVVSLTTFADGVAVGERGPDGDVRLLDGDTGAVRWAYRTADDVGEAQRDTRFCRPFVVDLVAGEDRVYAASRRYERDGDDRAFDGVVYAFDPDGSVAWTAETDASPISLDVRGDRVAVAYNRCPGTHQHGLVVLDADTGADRIHWDPGTPGQRRVGDVSLVDEGVAVASHGDYRGYLLDEHGGERWRVDLATPTEIGDETLYAYPNHVHATADGVAFVTGNTYLEDGRETDSLHPKEHTIFGVSSDGEVTWTDDVSGFATGVATDGGHVAVPGAQHFRERDPDVHGCRTFDVETGAGSGFETAGVVTATALADGTVAAVEEPVVYHDDGTERGGYRLRVER